MADFNLFGDEIKDDPLEEAFIPLDDDKPLSNITVEEEQAITAENNLDCFGHEDHENILLQMMKDNKLPHAIIFQGQAGIGKATLAHRLARYLLSEKKQPDQLQISADCIDFRRMLAQSHPDFMVVRRSFDEKKNKYKNEIVIEDIRKIEPFLRLKSSRGGQRVVIIDNADHMNTNSQNALLKILEEPPAHTTLILTAEQIGKFLPTIKSRVRIFKLKPLSDEIMSRLLRLHIPRHSQHEQKILIALSKGSIGDAINISENGGIDVYADMLSDLAKLPDIPLSFLHERADRFANDEGFFELYITLLKRKITDVIISFAKGVMPQNYVEEEEAVNQKLLSLFHQKEGLMKYDALLEVLELSRKAELDRRTTTFSLFSALSHIKGQ